MAGLFGTQIGSLVRVVDGDTVDVLLRTKWLNMSLTLPVGLRLNGLNTPELHGVADPTPGLAARQYVIDWLAVDPNNLTVELMGDDKYGGRTQGAITRSDGRTLNADLIRDGYAAAWDGRGKAPVAPWPPVPLKGQP